MQNPAVATVFVGGYSQLLDTAISTATSNTYTGNLGIFGVQSATRNGSLVTGNPGVLTSPQIANYLDQLIASNQVPQPLSSNQMYMLVLSNQTTIPDLPNAGAYHSETSYNGVPVVFTVVSAVGPNAGTYGVFHEYAEAATDPLFDGWYGSSPLTEEIADLAHGSDYNLQGVDAAAVVGPSGQLITSATPFTPIQQPPPPVVSFPSINLPGDGFLGGIVAFWEQEIDEIIGLWQQWEAQVLSWETALWGEIQVRV